MVSHPRLLLFADGVLSWSISLFLGWCPILVGVLFADSVLSWSLAPELQEDLLGTKVKKVLLIRSISEFLNPVLQEMSQHQNCKRCPSTSLYGLLSLYF